MIAYSSSSAWAQAWPNTPDSSFRALALKSSCSSIDIARTMNSDSVVAASKLRRAISSCRIWASSISFSHPFWFSVSSSSTRNGSGVTVSGIWGSGITSEQWFGAAETSASFASVLMPSWTSMSSCGISSHTCSSYAITSGICEKPFSIKRSFLKSEIRTGYLQLNRAKLSYFSFCKEGRLLCSLAIVF